MRVVSIPIAFVLAAFLASCSGDLPTETGVIDDDFEQAVAADPGSQEGRLDPNKTAFQQHVTDLYGERESQGLPVPSIDFRFESPDAQTLSELHAHKYGAGESFSYVATTVLQFDGPAEAGLDTWPDASLALKRQQTGVQSESFVRTAVEEQHPGIWSEYEYGREPRTLTITERRKATRPVASDVDALSIEKTEEEDLVLGFTEGMDRIEDGWSAGLSVLGVDFTFEIWWVVDWEFGLRLPVDYTVQLVDLMSEGQNYTAASTALGRNVPGFKEYVARLEIGGGVSVLGVDRPIGVFRNASEDFQPPIGPGLVDVGRYSIPIVDIDEGVDIGVADGSVEVGVDFVLDPSIRSEKFTADWTASQEALGSGSLEYFSPAPTNPTPDIGPFLAVDGPGYAQITVDDFEYHLDDGFEIEMSLDIDLGAELCVFLLGCADTDLDESIGLGSFGIDDVPGQFGFSVGPHSGYPDDLEVSVFIQNVAPTVNIDLGGTTEVNGTSTVIANTDEDVTFVGTATDPGRDDLTVTWDWDDGPPSPDVTTLHPVPGPTGPNNVSETQTHAFAEACLYEVTLKAVDDDDAFDEDTVPVIITEDGNRSRFEGYWQRQLAGVGRGTLAEEVIDCYLAIVDHMSTVFNESTDASTREAAYQVAFLKRNEGSEVEQFDRELLIVWLNFAAGAIQYNDMVDTNEDGIMDTVFHEAILEAETVRLDPLSTLAELRMWTVIVHKITEQYTG